MSDEERLTALRHVNTALDNLGVPQRDTPAPIVVAVEELLAAAGVLSNDGSTAEDNRIREARRTDRVMRETRIDGSTP